MRHRCRCAVSRITRIRLFPLFLRHRCRCAVSRITRIRLFPLFFHNGCSQSSRFPTAGQGERSSGNEIEQNQKHFLCPGHKICVRNKCCARGQTGNICDGNNVSATMCPQQCVRNNVSLFASTFTSSLLNVPISTWDAEKFEIKTFK